MPALAFHMLGPFDIRSGDRPLPLPPTLNSQSLLAYLVMHREQPQPRPRLAGLFWGERPEKKARSSLSTALWHIRRCLPSGDLVLTDMHTVQFDPHADIWLDVHEFERRLAQESSAALRAAVGLFRGDFLDGLYDDWVIAERYRLEVLFQAALGRLMVAYERAGEPLAALETALRLLAADPLREDAHRVAMRAYSRLGQRNAALAQYRRCTQVLLQELGAEPEAETVACHEAVLAREFPAAAASEARAFVAPQMPSPAGRSPLLAGSTKFVGRSADLARLDAAWQAVRAGAGRLVLVEGEAGVGKTRLLQEFASRLRWRGVRVLSGRCFEIERGLPYQPLVEALRPTLPGLGSAALDALPSWALAELARLLPELLPGEPAQVPPASGSGHERARLFEALAHLLAALSAQGALLLVLEDLHWAGESTLEMLHYLVRHLPGQAVLVVGTMRPEGLQPGHPLPALQQQLARQGLVETLPLPRLSPEDVQAIVVEMSGAGQAVRPLAARLYRETEGNPFYLMQIAGALFERDMIRLQEGRWEADFAALAQEELPLPAGLRDAIRARIGTLQADAREAAGLAAVIGDEFDYDLLAAVWRHGRERLLGALDDLLRYGLLAEGSGAVGRDYAFTHHKIRETIYADLPERRRLDTHARVGLAMEDVYAGTVAALAGEVAYHFEQGCGARRALTARAVHYLHQAGDQARGLYAHEEAIRFYQRALALLEKQGAYAEAARTLMKLGLAQHSAFRFSQAREAYNRGFALWQRAPAGSAAHSRPPAPHALRVEVHPAPSRLDPTRMVDSSSYTVVGQLFSALVRQTPEMDIIPEVAGHWDVLEGGTRYVFHLREDARWSDGTPVTAADFCSAWMRLLEPARGPLWAADLDVIRGARAFRTGRETRPESVGLRALDETTLAIDLEAPASHFLHLLPLLYPIPRHVVQRLGDGWARPGRIVSNGPFRLESWPEGQGLTLARNPHYPGRPSGNVERVEVCTAPDWPARRRLYETDRLDVLPLFGVPEAERQVLAQRHAGELISAPELTLLRVYHVTFNAWRAPFADPRVRRAFAHATDREALVAATLGGRASPATGGLVPPGMVGHSPEAGLPYDPALARQLLAQAGYPGGLGFPVLDAVVPGARKEQAQELRAQWRSVLGVDVAWREMPWPQMLEALDAHLPDLYLSAWVAGYPDPEAFLAAGSQVRGGHVWRDPAFEHLLQQSRATLGQAARIAILRQADRLLTRQGPFLPLYYLRYELLIKPWVSRYPLSPMGHDVPYWQDVVIDPH